MQSYTIVSMYGGAVRYETVMLSHLCKFLEAMKLEGRHVLFVIDGWPKITIPLSIETLDRSCAASLTPELN